jgi:hypothetical protein
LAEYRAVENVLFFGHGLEIFMPLNFNRMASALPEWLRGFVTRLLD